MSENSIQEISSFQLKTLLEYRDFKKLRALLKECEVADIAEALSEVSLEDCTAVLRRVANNMRAGVFSHMSFERQKLLVEELPDVILAALLNEMDPDDRTSFLESLSDELREIVLLKMSPEERKVAAQLLSYPDGSIGRIMTPDFLTLNVNMKVSEALNFIHWRSAALPVEFLNYLFVTSDDGALVGEVALSMLVVCDPQTSLLKTIMKKNHINLNPYDQAERAIEVFRKYDHYYIPVIDKERRVKGMVTSDDVFDLAEEEATEDIQQFGGQAALDNGYFDTPFITMLKKRAGALSVLFVGGFLTSEVLRSFDNELSRWSFLSFFIPLIIASGGNSGTQAASLIIRGLAIGEFKNIDSMKILKKELVIGFVLGGFLALLWCARAYMLELSSQETFIVGASIFGVVIFGVLSGSMLPFLFRKVKLDPAVVSSPFISTVVDVVGILIFLNIAIFVFKYFGSV